MAKVRYMSGTDVIVARQACEDLYWEWSACYSQKQAGGRAGRQVKAGLAEHNKPCLLLVAHFISQSEEKMCLHVLTIHHCIDESSNRHCMRWAWGSDYREHRSECSHVSSLVSSHGTSCNAQLSTCNRPDSVHLTNVKVLIMHHFV